MRRVAKEQSGFTLVELLVAMSLMIVVLTATLNSWDGFVSRQAKNTKIQEQQDAARFAIDRLVTQLRNLANPTTQSQATIDTAEDFKLIFQTTDPQKQWVMYCADTTGRTFWYQVSSNSGSLTAAMRAAGVCPSPQQSAPAGGGNYWTATTRITTGVNNGVGRPLLNYFFVDPTNGSSTVIATPVSTANKPKITGVTADLWIDNDTAHPPPETEIRSGAYLRNQNQAPTARFGVTGPSSPGKSYTFTASASSDPEQRSLQYDWYRTSGKPTQFPSTAPKANCPGGSTCLPDCPSKTVTTMPDGVSWTCIGSDVVLTRNFSVDTGTTQERVFLRVLDPGFLGDFSDVPSTGDCLQAPPSGARAAQTDCALVQSG